MKPISDGVYIYPQIIPNSNGDAWWYGEPRHLSLLHEIRIKGEYIRTDKLNIPIGQIRKYIASIDADKKRKRGK